MAQSNRKNLLVIHATWFLFWSADQLLLLHWFGLDWKRALTDAVATNFLLVAAGIATANVTRFYAPVKKNFFYRILMVLGLATICTAGVIKLLYFVFPSTDEWIAFLKISAPVRFAFAVLNIAFFTLSGILINKNREQREAEERKAHTEQLARDAELSRLRQQLHPHFLFNSLNSISALVGTQPQEARKMIQQLSDFLRGTLRKDDQQLVSLEEELRLLQLYMDIEKVRFSHRLSTPVDVTEESLPLQLPPLLLQPIVENAIKFGLYDTTDAVTIRVTAKKEERMLTIRVENPFDPQTAKPKQGAGFGLESVRRRLFLLYGRNDLLSVQQQDTTFITLLKIPQAYA